ncbi:MAG: hypothetical protein OK457_02770 [Thaumarchaeota archaeon]|nr:hypothetical protein [Nitrososphaerota archaeon]
MTLQLMSNIKTWHSENILEKGQLENTLKKPERDKLECVVRAAAAAMKIDCVGKRQKSRK